MAQNLPDLPEKYPELWDHLGESDRHELLVFETAVQETLAKFEASPVAQNKRDLDAARRGLQELVWRLEAQYLKHDEVFATRTEALKWLQAKGYAIRKTKLYSDARKGLLRLQKDKSVLKKDLEKYAKTLVFDGDPMEQAHLARKRKLELENARLEKKNEILELELQEKKKLYISRTDAELARAAVLSVYEAVMKNMVALSAGKWVKAVSGDARRVGDLIAQVLDDMAEASNRLADMSDFEVVFDLEEMADGPT